MTEREQQAHDMMQNIANDIIKKLPENMGFALLAYEFGDTDDRRLLYVSNSTRESVIMAIEEFLKNNLDDPEIFGRDV